MRAHARDARAAAPRERQPLDRARKRLIRVGRPERRSLGASATRAATRDRDTARDASAGAAASSAARGRGIGDDEVEPVEQRAGELVAIRGEALRRARALRGRIAAARRTGTGSSSRRAGTAPGRRARPAARAIETTPSSSGCRSPSSAGRANSAQLVEEQNAAMREARLARPDARAAADDRRGRRAVVRRAERRRAKQRLLGRRAGRRRSGCASPRAPSSSSSGGRMPGRRRASIVLPVPGGPASSRLWPPAAAISSARRARSWPADVGEVGQRRSGGAARRRQRIRLELAAQIRDRVGEVAERRPARCPRAPPRRRLRRAEHALEAHPPRALGDGEDAADAAEPAVERELADRRVPVELVVRQLPRRGEHRERDRQVVARAFLAQPGRARG